VPLTVVVGGQYGSEGKGKLVSHLACADARPVGVVRCGGANAGHTAEGHGRRAMLRQLPSGVVNEDAHLLLAAGMQLSLPVLLDELRAFAPEAARLTIDPNATMIEVADEMTEREAGLRERVGSTLSGTGAAMARKLMRDPSVRRAADIPALAPYLGCVSSAARRLLNEGAHVIVEGTQGAGLSLHHGAYPFVTARDTTAAGVLSEAGLPPTLVDDVIVVFRTYPIRVAGNSGPLNGDLAWETVQQRSDYPTALAEYTTVTGRLRRVAEWDWELAERAIELNAPTALAIHGLDYLDHRDLGCRTYEALGERSKTFIWEVEYRLEVSVRYLFTGPDGADLIDRLVPCCAADDRDGAIRMRRGERP
jgi:adenylosuccinate synthase